MDNKHTLREKLLLVLYVVFSFGLGIYLCVITKGRIAVISDAVNDLKAVAAGIIFIVCGFVIQLLRITGAKKTNGISFSINKLYTERILSQLGNSASEKDFELWADILIRTVVFAMPLVGTATILSAAENHIDSYAVTTAKDIILAFIYELVGAYIILRSYLLGRLRQNYFEVYPSDELVGEVIQIRVSGVVKNKQKYFPTVQFRSRDKELIYRSELNAGSRSKYVIGNKVDILYCEETNKAILKAERRKLNIIACLGVLMLIVGNIEFALFLF